MDNVQRYVDYYDGHYSSFISVDIPAEDDDSDFQSEITEVIRNQLEKASEWKKLQKREKVVADTNIPVYK